MRVTVKLFAVLREKAGKSQLILDCAPGATVASAVAMIRDEYPSISELVAKAAYAVNQEYAPAARVLSDGDELALIPAVSGGAR